MTILGIDEAGRGAVIGPLVIAGAMAKEEDHDTIKELGVKDSKLLSPKRREELAEQLESKLLKYKIIEIPPEVIDVSRLNLGINLNELEMKNMAEIINELKPKKAYVDAVDANIKNVHYQIKKYLRVDAKIIAEHKADATYPIVSAASIIAKVTRDRRIEELKEKYGEIGSGYPSDPTTKTFLSEWFKENRSFPSFVRKSWETIAEFEAKRKQTSLKEFK